MWLPLFVQRKENMTNFDEGSLETSEREAVPLGLIPTRRAARLIGLTGVARSGKDTAADFLVREYGFVKHSFAAPIREFVARVLGLDLGELEACKESPVHWLSGKTPRYLMQTIGTEWGRDTIDPELWVKSCFERAKRDMSAGRSVVICDVRFDNEARALQGTGGEVWRMVRPGAGTTSVHASEAGVDPRLVTETFVNDGTVRELYRAISGALRIPRA